MTTKQHADYSLVMKGYEGPKNTDRLFGYPSNTVDRAVAYIEEIILPPATTRQGELSLTIGNKKQTSVAKDNIGRKKKLLSGVFQREKKKSFEVDGTTVVDLRFMYPNNWAHTLTNHLPLAVLICSMAGLKFQDVTLILPQTVSQNISEIYRLAGFNVVVNDSPVVGRICEYSLSPWISMRGIRANVILENLASSQLVQKIVSEKKLASKVYLARRGKRAVSNHVELDEFMLKEGYTKVYMEDYSAVQQLAILFHADDVVAVHGASLGSQIFKVFNDKPYNLIEIFSPAHISNVYRVLAHQTGGRWAGVRGKLWPGLFEKGANFSSNMQDFEVSIESVEASIDSLKESC